MTDPTSGNTLAFHAPVAQDPSHLQGYVSRVDYFREVCRGKRVLHLGCSSGRFLEDRVRRGTLLHSVLQQEADELYGIDLDGESLEAMRERMGFRNLYQADAQRLEQLDLHETFDVVLAGDLLEHLTAPGALLDGVRRFLRPGGKFIVSTVNAFGLNFQLRRWLGSYAEHPEHVCFFSPETIVHLLERHRYIVQALCGCYTEPPTTWKRKMEFGIGGPLFKRAPVLAGTLIAVATPALT
jgi:2-polyprenyl-3-methyl-5-hydroxy-6-metoxy-1,4-benzoquinol methylase